jgi:hypothetical protein
MIMMVVVVVVVVAITMTVIIIGPIFELETPAFDLLLWHAKRHRQV